MKKEKTNRREFGGKTRTGSKTAANTSADETINSEPEVTKNSCERLLTPCGFQYLPAEGALTLNRKKQLTSCFLVPTGLVVMTRAPPAGLLLSRPGLLILISHRIGFQKIHFHIN